MMRKFFLILFTGYIVLTGSTYAKGIQATFQDTITVDKNIYDEDVDIEMDELHDGYTNKWDRTRADTTLFFNKLTINPDSIAALKNSKSFAYIKNLDSLLKAEQDNKKPSKKTKQRSDFFEKLFSSGIIKILFWTLGICFVLFLLYRLFLADGVFQRNSIKHKPIQDDQEDDADLIGNSDFNVLIDQALKTGNYRLAIRYNYLKSLQLLANYGFLQIAPDKTNYQYVREISNYEYQNIFSTLTLHYEYVWYGEFNIDEVIYQKIETDFIKFNKNFK